MADSQEKTPLLSIIILNYQTPQLVLDLLKNLEPDKSSEVIVVDNSSTNELESKIPKVSNIKYFFVGKNLGFAGGCNFGIKNSKGEWLLLLNSDTKTSLTDIKKLVELAQAEKMYIAAPKLTYGDGRTQDSVGYFDPLTKNPLNWLFLRPRFINADNVSDNKVVDVATGAALLIKRTVFEEVGLLDEKSFFMYFEDMDFSYRLSKNKIKILYAPQVKIVHYEGSTSNLEINKKNENYDKALYNYLLKHRGIIVALINKIFKFLK